MPSTAARPRLRDITSKLWLAWMIAATRRSSSSPTRTIPTAGCLRAAIFSRSPPIFAGAAACSSSTKRSWTSLRRDKASRRMWQAATSSCCARSANFSDWQVCGSALCSPLRRSAGKLPRHLDLGRSPDLQSLSARRRSPTRLGSSAHARGSTSRRKGSTPCWPIWRCRCVGGTSLFRLVQTPAANALFQHLGEAGIWVRAFAQNPKWLRFGLPGNEAAWKRLKAALVAFW